MTVIRYLIANLLAAFTVPTISGFGMALQFITSDAIFRRVVEFSWSLELQPVIFLNSTGSFVTSSWFSPFIVMSISWMDVVPNLHHLCLSISKDGGRCSTFIMSWYHFIYPTDTGNSTEVMNFRDPCGRCSYELERCGELRTFLEWMREFVDALCHISIHVQIERWGCQPFWVMTTKALWMCEFVDALCLISIHVQTRRWGCQPLWAMTTKALWMCEFIDALCLISIHVQTRRWGCQPLWAMTTKTLWMCEFVDVLCLISFHVQTQRRGCQPLWAMTTEALWMCEIVDALCLISIHVQTQRWGCQCL
jgi:hypothetical protein